MFFSFPALFHTLLFAAVHEIIVLIKAKSSLEFYAYSELTVTALFLVFISLLAVWSARKLGKKWNCVIVPAVFSFSSALLHYLIDSAVEKQIFILLSSVLYYFTLLGTYRLGDYQKDQTARGLVSASLATTAFFFYSSVYGVYLNFAVSLWILMLLFLGVTYGISRQYFLLVNSDKKIVSVYSLILAMAMAEIAWIINFWPFGYLTTGVIVLMLYYVLWDLIQSHFLNLLSKRRLAANVAFFSFLIILILATSKWLPAI